MFRPCPLMPAPHQPRARNTSFRTPLTACLSAALTACALLCAPAAWAQTPRYQAADYIVAVVNSEPITNAEVQATMRRITLQMRQQQQTPPPAAELQSKVLERLISERAQLQLARDLGVRVDNSDVDQAEKMLAQQNQTDVTELRKRMEKEGIDTQRLREQLRDQLTLDRLHEREVEARLRVSDAELETYLQEELRQNPNPLAEQINLAQILVAVPENASVKQTAELHAQAQALLQRLRAGENFETLVRSSSNAARDQGGQLGLRVAARYPQSFVSATQKLPVGGISDIVTSGAGFHILKVVQRILPSAPSRSVNQTHASHILLRSSPQLSQAQAIAQLNDLKQRITSGKTSFASAAREFSQDGSAPQGGDLGWAGPGMFVPEFEDAMNKLSLGSISPPVVSRFGVHLIQVNERRSAELTADEVRELLRSELRQKKLEEAYITWAKDVRSRAYVEMREAPQ